MVSLLSNKTWSERIFLGPRTSQVAHPLGVLSSWCALHQSWDPKGPKVSGSSLWRSYWGTPCYKEPIRDDHSDKVYIKLKVFIPTSRDYTSIKDPMQYLELGIFKGRNHIMAPPLAANREVLHKQAICQKLS